MTWRQVGVGQYKAVPGQGRALRSWPLTAAPGRRR